MEYSVARALIEKNNNCTLPIVALKNNDIKNNNVDQLASSLMLASNPTLKPASNVSNVSKPTSNVSKPTSNISTIYYLIGILCVLIIIAVLYKKK